MDIIRIPLKKYIHVKDKIKNIRYLIEGAKNYPLNSNEELIENISSHVQLKPSSYVIIENPVERKDKQIVLDQYGQAQLRWGEQEVRTDIDYKDPFPLYPGEKLIKNITPFLIVQANQEIQLKCLIPFHDPIKNKERRQGDEWMYRGPMNYIERIECEIIQKINATIILPRTALLLEALRDMEDKNNIKRKAGEKWLYREPGSFLPSKDEKIIKQVKAETITDKTALHLKAISNLKDMYGIERKAGDHWLITLEQSDTHIPDVSEEIVERVNITVLSSRQFCVIKNPVIEGQPQYGKRKKINGEISFFLQPGEELEQGIEDIIVLDENDALLLQANNTFEDEGVNKIAGERWLIKGPREYSPPLEVQILEERRAIPLDDNEGIYVRNISTGEVKMISGQTYLLGANEELFQKELSPLVENLLKNTVAALFYEDKQNQVNENKRDKFRVVTYRAPDNYAVQVFDYQKMISRVIFGPELIKLGPHEDFTVIELSGKKPKVENQIKTLALLLGPDFMSDIIEVETRDHARLSLNLCYSWKFELINKKDEVENNKLFTVNDFVGNACKDLASKIRGAVSTVSFEAFHKNSATIVRQAVFGLESNGPVKSAFKYDFNNLVITNVDIQSQEPCDPKTRENLNKSTNLSILSLNDMQKADAEHKQKIYSEESSSNLIRQKLKDDTHAERQNIEFLKKKIETEVVKISGVLKAKANAVATSNKIRGESILQETKYNIQAKEINEIGNLIEEEINIKQEILQKEQSLDVDIEMKKKMSQIEVEEFQKTVKAIGKETLVALAQAGPKVQQEILKSLGIKSFLITDGKNPINLFNTAKGLSESNYGN